MTTSRKAAASATVRASGPFTLNPYASPWGAGETRPLVALIPNRPQHEAGMRIEPPPSDPCAIGASPAATAAAAPPLDPPGVRERSHGFRHTPLSTDSVTAVVPNSGVLVLPRITNPAARNRRTTAMSCSGTWLANARQ